MVRVVEVVGGVSDSDTVVMGAVPAVAVAVALAGAISCAGAAGARVEVDVVVADHAGCCATVAGRDVIVIVVAVVVGDKGPRVPRAGGVVVVVGRAVAVEAVHVHCACAKGELCSVPGLKFGVSS